MTDERIGEALWPALRRLPPGSGVVFRHHATAPAMRRALLRRIERIATARRLLVLVAGGAGGKGGAHGGGGVHGGARGHGRGGGRGVGPRSSAAHDRREAIAGVRQGATLLFVSPVFATRSHPQASPLGQRRAARIGQGLGVAVIALGGMNERRWRRIRRSGFDGWAAIDAWLPPRDRSADQKWKTVPT